MIKKVLKIFIDTNTRIVVVFKREKKIIINFVVVLEVKGEIVDLESTKWIQVLRFDTAHLCAEALRCAGTWLSSHG